jgi:anhydro-N-acetylmuramic acid kinase
MANSKSKYYIGINSGTSLDGIDFAIFSFHENKVITLHTHKLEFPINIVAELKVISTCNASIEIKQVGQLQSELGHLYAKGANELLRLAKIDSNEITAIGCHGQTVYHSPCSNPPYSIQLNNGAVIAQLTHIDTIVDFRSADLALGGQGAPLAPAFHKAFFYDSQPVAVINLGGIANLTIITNAGLTIGYDIGPANCLLDMWINKTKGLNVDINGQYAAQGCIVQGVLKKLKSDRYFKLPHPKSTGVDYFNLQWLSSCISNLEKISAEDIQATLCELTAASIANEISQFKSNISHIYLCGGGANNAYLVQRIRQNIPNKKVYLSGDIGIDHEWVECAGFAWLAKQHVEHELIDLTSVTGSSRPVVLGAFYPSS